MSYFHETIWKGVPKFLRRVDTALKNIGINERVPYNAPVIQFSSWMGGDRDGIFLFPKKLLNEKKKFINQISLYNKTLLLPQVFMWYRFEMPKTQLVIYFLLAVLLYV